MLLALGTFLCGTGCGGRRKRLLPRRLAQFLRIMSGLGNFHAGSTLGALNHLPRTGTLRPQNAGTTGTGEEQLFWSGTGHGIIRGSVRPVLGYLTPHRLSKQDFMTILNYQIMIQFGGFCPPPGDSINPHRIHPAKNMYTVRNCPVLIQPK